MKRLGLLTVVTVLSLSLAITPVFAPGVFSPEPSYAATAGQEDPNFTMTDSTLNKLDGMTVTKVKKDPKLAPLLEDPTFTRYFDITSSGVIKKKKVDTDEVDQFIAAMDANAEGINSKELAQVNSDMTSVGCGVSGIGKAQVPSKYSSLARANCIDISWWQGTVTPEKWQQIKAAGVTHAIIRCGYSTLADGTKNIDSTFDNNIKTAYNAGIKVGVYYYSTATTAAEAKAEADYVVSQLANYRQYISMPVAFDYETGGRLTASVMKKNGTASCIAFCDAIQAAGYTPMVYANYTTLTSYIDYKTLQSKYRIWLAHYTTNGVATEYPGDYAIWQYSSSGKVNGLSGNVDINYVFGDGGTAVPGVAAGSTAVMPAKGAAAVTTCSMNYRKGPSTSKKVVGSYPKGTLVYFTSTTGNWAKLSNGYYMNRSNMKYTAKTKCKVNYRTGPGTKYKKKGTYKKGTYVTIVSVKNGWAKLDNGYYLAVHNTKKQ